MRLKLLLIASLAASVVGAGASIAIILGVFSSLRAISSPGLLMLATLVLPLVTSLLASIFVYRHTSRRRKLQATLTVILSLLLSLAAFIVTWLVTARNEPAPAPPREQRPVASSFKRDSNRSSIVLGAALL